MFKLSITNSLTHELRNPLNGIIGVFSHLEECLNDKILPFIQEGLANTSILRYRIESFIDYCHIICNEFVLNINVLKIKQIIS